MWYFACKKTTSEERKQLETTRVAPTYKATVVLSSLHSHFK